MIDPNTLPADIRAPYENLRSIIEGYGSMVVAFSGGVDSGLLACVARDVLVDRMLSVIAVSPSLPERDEAEAVAFLEERRIPFVRVATNEIDNDAYIKNTPERCYHCKGELFSKLRELAASRGFGHVAYGSNVDDGEDYRPGHAAADENGVVAPLVEAGLGKYAIRRLARALGLAMWDKPASPCLASRIPYFEEVTREKLGQIDAAERALKENGFPVCRVRHHGRTARVEVPIEEHPRLVDGDEWAVLVKRIKAAGFDDVALEPEGFRSGRLNDMLKRT